MVTMLINQHCMIVLNVYSIIWRLSIMASELRVDTLKDSSGNNSVGMSYVAGGSAKFWVNFNNTSNSVR